MQELFNPKNKKPFKISRTAIDLFTNCPRCFCLEKIFGVKRPQGPAFTLNSAVDYLLKKEFDIHRAKKSIHPLMKAYKIDAVPMAHPDLNKWRENFVGLEYFHKPTNLLITGAIDDLWIGKNNKLMVVDYKATSTKDEIDLNDKYKKGFKKQMEVYQWILSKNGFDVDRTGYFVYCNAQKDRESFDGILEFNVKIIPYTGNNAWVETVIFEIKKILNKKTLPDPREDCEFCNYRLKAKKFEK